MWYWTWKYRLLPSLHALASKSTKETASWRLLNEIQFIKQPFSWFSMFVLWFSWCTGCPRHWPRVVSSCYKLIESGERLVWVWQSSWSWPCLSQLCSPGPGGHPIHSTTWLLRSWSVKVSLGLQTLYSEYYCPTKYVMSRYTALIILASNNSFSRLTIWLCLCLSLPLFNVWVGLEQTILFITVPIFIITTYFARLKLNFDGDNAQDSDTYFTLRQLIY